MKPEPASQRRASESPSRSRPERSGLKTAGPRIAPKTAPARTSAIPLARRSGGYMSPAAARARSDVPARRAHEDQAEEDGHGRLEGASERRQHAAERPDRRSPTASTGTRPKRSIARPAGSAASAPEASTIAGPSPSSPFTPVTSTNVSEATAAESWSIPELAARAAERSAVFRLMGRSRAAGDAITGKRSPEAPP